MLNFFSLMCIEDRIRLFCEMSGISLNRFEVMSGLSKSYTRRVKRTMGPDKKQLISDAFPYLNIDWLITGRGNIVKPEFQKDYPHMVLSQGNNHRTQIGGRNNSSSVTNNYNGCCPASIVSGSPELDSAVWSNASSVSMVSDIRMGDLVAMRNISDWEEFFLLRRIYFVTMKNGTRLFCRLVPSENENSLRLSGDIESDEDQEVSKDKIKSISEVIAVTRML